MVSMLRRESITPLVDLDQIVARELAAFPKQSHKESICSKSLQVGHLASGCLMRISMSTRVHVIGGAFRTVKLLLTGIARPVTSVVHMSSAIHLLAKRTIAGIAPMHTESLSFVGRAAVRICAGQQML